MAEPLRESEWFAKYRVERQDFFFHSENRLDRLGYVVEYEDGRIGWVPKNEFEQAYSLLEGP